MANYKGYQLIRRYDNTRARWLIVGQDGWTVDRANTLKAVKAKINEMLKGGRQ